MKFSSKTELLKSWSAFEILRLLKDCITKGDDSVEVSRIRPLRDATINDITFCVPRKDLPSLELVRETKASVVICEQELLEQLCPKSNQCFIFVENAKAVFGYIVSIIVDTPQDFLSSSSSNISASNFSCGENVVIGNNVSIGAGTIIYPNTVIYDDVSIGKDCVIHACCSIGHPGLGPIGNASDGWTQFPDLGTVEIGNGVYIGANCSIARSPLGATVIEDGVRIANMVNIGHNAHIGENSVITSMSMVARGHIGKGVWIAPGVTIRPGMDVGDNATIGTGAVVTKPVCSNSVVFGVPAKEKS